MVGGVAVNFSCGTTSLTLPSIFQKENHSRMVEIKEPAGASKKMPLLVEDENVRKPHCGITIQAVKFGGPKRVIF